MNIVNPVFPSQSHFMIPQVPLRTFPLELDRIICHYTFLDTQPLDKQRIRYLMPIIRCLDYALQIVPDRALEENRSNLQNAVIRKAWGIYERLWIRRSLETNPKSPLDDKNIDFYTRCRLFTEMRRCPDYEFVYFGKCGDKDSAASKLEPLIMSSHTNSYDKEQIKGDTEDLIFLGARSSSSTGMTVLHRACYIGVDMEIINMLVSEGISVDVRSDVGATPLHVTMTVEVAKGLIEAGADPFATFRLEYYPKQQCTPLLYLCQYSNPGIGKGLVYQQLCDYLFTLMKDRNGGELPVVSFGVAPYFTP